MGIFRREVQFVGDDDDGVAILGREPPQRIQQANLRGDIQVKSGLIEQQKKRLLSQSARKDDALLFAAGDLVHPAVAQVGGTNLGESVFRDQDIVFGFKAQRAAVGVAALQNKFPRARGEKQSALLLNYGDSLRARARRKRVGDESVEQNPSREWSERAGDQFQQ